MKDFYLIYRVGKNPFLSPKTRGLGFLLVLQFKPGIICSVETGQSSLAYSDLINSRLLLLCSYHRICINDNYPCITINKILHKKRFRWYTLFIKLRAFTIEYLDKLNEYLNNHYNLCIRIEPAPPPPLQRLAMPYSPGFKTFNRWLVILAPDILKKY